MDIKPYRRLSRIYDSDWAVFPDRFADFVLHHLTGTPSKNMHVLDLACGTGILAIKLSRRVASVLGVDLSGAMIDIARSKAAGLKNVSFKTGDMRRFRSKREFDLCTCSYDAINYLLTYSDLQTFFDRVSESLYRGGLFIFDGNTEAHYRAVSGIKINKETDLGPVRQSVRYIPSKNRNVVTFDFPGGYRESHVQRPYNYRELSPRLKKAGFRVVAKYGNMMLEDYTARSHRLFCVARQT
jgi:SAM-dependent methyltransferase